jgi:Protein of unknown function (DUF3995)
LASDLSRWWGPTAVLDGQRCPWWGGALTLALLAIGLLHAVRTVSTWPLADREDYARLVGVPVAELPSPGLTAAVAAALLMASGWVGVQARLLPGGPVPVGLWRIGVVVAVVLLLRGSVGLVVELAGVDQGPADFARMDRIVCSLLCVTLGLAAAWVASRGLGSARE